MRLCSVGDRSLDELSELEPSLLAEKKIGNGPGDLDKISAPTLTDVNGSSLTAIVFLPTSNYSSRKAPPSLDDVLLLTTLNRGAQRPEHVLAQDPTI